MLDDTLIAFTPGRAAQLSGLSRRQIDYWRKTLLLMPSTDEPVSAHRSVRLYDFTDMLALMTVAELLERKVPLQRVRKIVDAMRAEGHDQPLTSIRYGVVPLEGKRERVLVVLTLEDGSHVGDDDFGQAVLAETINVEAIVAQLRRSTRRAAEDVGRIERRTNTLGRKEVFAGTRVPVETVKNYLLEGVSEAEILEAFPALAHGDIDAARRAS